VHRVFDAVASADLFDQADRAGDRSGGIVRQTEGE
jgi:hypothetical protein